MLAAENIQHIFKDADGIIAVHQRRAERGEGRRPGAQDIRPETNARPFDRKGHQETDTAAVVNFVAHDHEADLAVFKTRHGGSQKARVEEDVGLRRAPGQELEFFGQFKSGASRIDRQAARRTGPGNALHLRQNGLFKVKARKAGHHGGSRAAAGLFFKDRCRGHYEFT